MIFPTAAGGILSGGIAHVSLWLKIMAAEVNKKQSGVRNKGAIWILYKESYIPKPEYRPIEPTVVLL